MLHEWRAAAAGEAPPPRSRHSAGLNRSVEGAAAAVATGGGVPLSLLVFGGETDAAEQTDELYELDIAAGAWSRVRPQAGAPWPAPRHLATARLCYIPSCDGLALYGGAHYVAGNIRSFADVWLYCPQSRTWHCVVGEGGQDGRLPPCNGHSGIVLPRGVYEAETDVVLFVGGKESAVGEDRVKRLAFSFPKEESRPLLPEACECVCSLVEAEESGPHGGATREAAAAAAVEPAVSTGSPGTPHWRYMPAVVPLPLAAAAGEPGAQRMVLLLLGGTCRHEQADAAFVLFA
ncbi:hypothetical protein STCU_07440 [Strigomonas culicis]|uniref:Uncharacterized protein n=1 Tax=Strigomonas culicis TaxID=28005 RepID=S9TZ57_9TRYP|nr:hypothetical protein STCU_07440 [Strigomonas culicis]|eukprot:EPY23822.1 hypothetical protein STCU_07440 [Strigomonas culicis]